MEPPEIIKLVGRPKMKRSRQSDEASLRKGAWKQSRKGNLMRCNKCGDFNHNVRGCFKDHEGGKSSQGRSKKTSGQRSRSHVGQSSTQSANVEYETEVATQQSQTQQSMVLRLEMKKIHY
ncbi:Dolichol phosphate-mannose biosynthesis regulatory protein [Datura stramonium]|uniref:Dolichol phosphate-mannose biosynthesis regulatory protein n=1 Tax=Datura stramonium TaxID=4076 RepID=A0ABS8RYN0_DATST|nr:Dolichol phosphate-mannose biosynthesis regulatory protein [Datura stramonium]